MGVDVFFGELRRRKVYRVDDGYAVVGWALIQVTVTIFPAFNLPNWALRFVVLAMLAGFPIALVMSWALDIGPRGIEKTAPELSTQQSGAALRPRRRNIYVLGFIGLVIAAGAGSLLLPHIAGARVEKSIAVLPFENFSEDKENEYFADGIKDDVLTRLA